MFYVLILVKNYISIYQNMTPIILSYILKMILVMFYLWLYYFHIQNKKNSPLKLLLLLWSNPAPFSSPCCWKLRAQRYIYDRF